MNRIWLICLFTGVSAGVLFCQQGAFQEALQGKETFQEITAVMEEYFLNKGTRNTPSEGIFEPRDIHVARWAYFMSSRLGPDGFFVNIPKALIKASSARAELVSPAQRISVGNWAFVGPSSTTSTGTTFSAGLGLGRIDRIAFHPTVPSTIYAGTPSGGLWKTTNYGGTWTSLTSNLPSIGISGIVVSHANPNTLYILTGDGDSYILGGFVTSMEYGRLSAGVFKSTDGGLTWQKTGSMGPNEGIVGYNIVQSPTDAQVLLAATEEGIYRTADGGSSWTLVDSTRTYDVAFKPGDGSTAYAVINAYRRFWHSSDGGETWSDANIYSSTMTRLNIAVTPDDPARVYVLSGPNIDSTGFRGVWESTNSGLSFTQVTNTPNILGTAEDGSANDDGSTFTLAFAASPVNADHFVTGSFICWRSTDGGATIQNITPYWEVTNPSAYVHPDIHDLAYNPIDGYLYAAGDGGLYRSTDNGTTWTFVSNGVNTTQFYHAAGTETDANRLLGGTQDNGIKLRTSATSNFDHVICCDGFDVKFNPTDNTQFLATVNTSFHRVWNNGLNQTGPTYPGADSTQWFSSVLYHNTTPSTYFMGANVIYKTTNTGATWTNTGGAGNWSLAAAPSDNTRFYAAGGASAWSQNGQIYRSSNTGTTWTILTNPAPGIKITDIAVNPADAEKVWITVGGFTSGTKVFYSSNGGTSWTNQSGALPNVPVHCLAVDVSNNVYAGTDIGVYFRSASQNDWTPFYNGLPNIPVTDLIINTGAGKIRAATFGRGIWESDVFTPCPVAHLISLFPVSGNTLYEATQFVHISVPVIGGANSSLHLRAGDYVSFLPGFEVLIGTEVHGVIGPCSAGIPD